MLIQSKRVWIADQFIPAIIEIQGEKISNIYPYKSKRVDIDYGNKRILPGLIDIHCHGAFGFDTNDANPEGLRNWTKNIVKEGVTAFCPTTITQSEEILKDALKNVADVISEGYEGAEILGVHLEGPFLSKEYKGAQPEEYIIEPSIETFRRLQASARGNIKYITLAPEMDKNFELTRYCANQNVVVSMGHSAATYEECLMAIAYGAKSMTHVYNGMSRFGHRENGLTGAAIRIRNIFGEIICDGLHSTTAALNAYFMSKGPDYPIMISDAVMAKGCPAGSKLLFGGQEIEVYDDGSAHVCETGGLAGSTLKLNEGLKILVEDALIPVNHAINACTINPAKCLGIDDHKGSIQVGKDADLVVLRNNYAVIQTFCKGKLCLF